MEAECLSPVISCWSLHWPRHHTPSPKSHQHTSKPTHTSLAAAFHFNLYVWGRGDVKVRGPRDGGKSPHSYISRLPFKHFINPGVVFVPLFFWDGLHMVAHLFLGQFALNIDSSLVASQYWTDLYIKCGNSSPLQLRTTNTWGFMYKKGRDIDPKTSFTFKRKSRCSKCCECPNPKYVSFEELNHWWIDHTRVHVLLLSQNACAYWKKLIFWIGISLIPQLISGRTLFTTSFKHFEIR